MMETARGNVTNGFPIDILLVEDNEADIKLTLRAFERAKLKNNISVVRNGEEALAYVYHQAPFEDAKQYPTPDLILLDINMPKINGFQVLERLKADPVYKVIPIVMLTSSQNDEDIVRSFGNGAASFIPKPVTYDDFVKVVDGFNFYWHIVNKLPPNAP